MSQKPDSHRASSARLRLAFTVIAAMNNSTRAPRPERVPRQRHAAVEELARAAEPFARVVILRLGIVLAANGGALAKLLLPFRLGVGGPMAPDANGCRGSIVRTFSG